MNYFPASKSYSFDIINLQKNEKITNTHANTNMFSLILCESEEKSCVDLYINGKLKKINDTSFLLFIYKDQQYKIIANSKTKIKMFYFNPINFLDNRSRAEISTLKIYEYKNYTYTSIFLDSENYHCSIIYLAKASFALLEENNSSLLNDIKNIIFQLIKLIEKEMLYIGYKQLPYNQDRDYEDILPAINLMQHNLESGELNMRVDDLANAANISKISLIRKFKKVFNQTPYNYYNERKLVYSAQLLAKTNSTIGEIAMVLGYSTVYAYEISFKKIYKVSPSEYRKNNK